MNEIKKYWNSHSISRSIYTCPNACLYRFIHHIGIALEKKTVLDLGFGSGQDLFEMLRRGAKIYGIDIDRRQVAEIKKLKAQNEFPVLLHGDISKDIEKFNQRFDLIYSQDTLYYLDDGSFKDCLESIKRVLLPEGNFLFQVITGDYSIIDNKEQFNPKAILKDSGNPIIFRDREYYISSLQNKGFNVIAEKVVNESFFNNYEAMRHNLYICCSVEK